MKCWIVARAQTIPRYFNTSSKDPNAVWTRKFLSPLKWYNPKDIIYLPQQSPLSPMFCEHKSWQRATGPNPIVPEFFFVGLFVPSSILLPRLEIPHILSSKECSSCWPKSLPGNEEQLFICGFVSLVASSLTALRQTMLLPELFHQPFLIGEQLLSSHLLVGASADFFYKQPGSWSLKAQRPFICYGI